MQAPSRIRWFALVGLWLVYATFGATAASLAPLLSEIRSDLATGNAFMGMILGAWPLVYVVAAIPCGYFLDKFGPRAGLFSATVVIALSALLRGVADTPVDMLFAVAVFGIGGPLISVGAPKLIAGLFSGADRGMAMGLYITGPSVGAIATMSLTNGVLLPLVGDWRGVILLHAGVALASGFAWLGLAALAKLPKVSVAPERFDRKAFAAMMRDHKVLLVLFMGVGIFYLNHALNNWLPELLRGTGMNPVMAGQWASIPTLVGLGAAVIIPRFATPTRRLWIMAGLAGVALISSLLLRLDPGIGLLVGLVLQGLARGTLNTLAILILVELPAIPPARLGLAGGVFFSAAEIGGVLGPLCFGALVAATGDFDTPLASLTLVSVALLALIGLLARRTRHPTD